MEDAGEILTIGGPGGHPRYCFPNPARVSRRRYYGKSFPVDGLVVNLVEDPGVIRWRGSFFDFYKVNGTSEPTILATRFGCTALSPKQHIRAFGILESFANASKLVGIEKPSADLRAKTVLFARKVATVTGDLEQELMFDPNPFRQVAVRTPKRAGPAST
jgi:hypothetical protein